MSNQANTEYISDQKTQIFEEWPLLFLKVKFKVVFYKGLRGVSCSLTFFHVIKLASLFNHHCELACRITLVL